VRCSSQADGQAAATAAGEAAGFPLCSFVLKGFSLPLAPQRKYPKNWYNRRNKFDLKKITPL
jgi:hypothetical protein